MSRSAASFLQQPSRPETPEWLGRLMIRVTTLKTHPKEQFR
jgi:hypothetical protein